MSAKTTAYLSPDFYDVWKLAHNTSAHVHHVCSVVCDKTNETVCTILCHNLDDKLCSTIRKVRMLPNALRCRIGTALAFVLDRHLQCSLQNVSGLRDSVRQARLSACLGT